MCSGTGGGCMSMCMVCFVVVCILCIVGNQGRMIGGILTNCASVIYNMLLGVSTCAVSTSSGVAGWLIYGAGA